MDPNDPKAKARLKYLAKQSVHNARTMSRNAKAIVDKVLQDHTDDLASKATQLQLSEIIDKMMRDNEEYVLDQKLRAAFLKDGIVYTPKPRITISGPSA